jgi:hypothetical protein
LIFDDSEAKGRIGIHSVELAVSKMGWIVRDQPVSDTGIDAHLEPVDENHKATGRLIGCQVKSGPSYLEEETSCSYIYRGDMEHLAYWRGHSLPVIVVLYDEKTGQCHWQIVNDKTAIITGKGWKLEIPKSNVLGIEAKPRLRLIADTGWLESAQTLTTPEKFFRRVETNLLFGYEQRLRGRQASLAEMHAFLENDDATIAVLTGRGGVGKSKLIRHWVSEISGWTVFLKRKTVQVSSTTEQEFGASRCLIVVDDAHRQPDIDTLLQLVRDLKGAGKTIKVLLSCRPIGLQRIDASLSRSFDPSAVVRVKELKKLNETDVRALAEETLAPRHLQLVPYLVGVSKDTPLVTVIGVRLLKRDAVLAKDLPGVDDFRRAVFAKFLEDFEAVAQRTRETCGHCYISSLHFSLCS